MAPRRRPEPERPAPARAASRAAHGHRSETPSATPGFCLEVERPPYDQLGDGRLCCPAASQGSELRWSRPQGRVHLHAPGPRTRALRHRTHLVKDDPGRRPRRQLYRPHRGPPRLPEEVSVGDIKERHPKMAPHLRQHLQHPLGDRATGPEGFPVAEPSRAPGADGHPGRTGRMAPDPLRSISFPGAPSQDTAAPAPQH